MTLGSTLSVFVVDVDANSMTFGALKTGLKFDDFPWPPRCAPGSRVGRKWVVARLFWGPLNHSDSIAADSM